MLLHSPQISYRKKNSLRIYVVMPSEKKRICRSSVIDVEKRKYHNEMLELQAELKLPYNLYVEEDRMQSMPLENKNGVSIFLVVANTIRKDATAWDTVLRTSKVIVCTMVLSCRNMLQKCTRDYLKVKWPVVKNMWEHVTTWLVVKGFFCIWRFSWGFDARYLRWCFKDLWVVRRFQPKY